MKANKATCPKGHEYLVNHQSAECPHERFVDLTVNKLSEGRLLTGDDILYFITDYDIQHKPFGTGLRIAKAQDAKTFPVAYQKGWDECALIKDAELDIKEAEKKQKQMGIDDLKRQLVELDAEHQQKVREIFEYECKDCSTPGFRHLVIPEKVASRILGGK